ncbi:MAG TPA: cell division protein SepF [Methanospirillum sp.]|nr:cell division protein SepF [Methanospirillum sp.]
MGLRDLIFGSKDNADPEDYKELPLKDYEAGEMPALIVKVANVTGLRESQIIKDEIYEGNIVIVDINRLKMDKINYERVMKDFYQVARDVDGDIVGLGDQQYLVITPRNVKVSRDRIGGGA